MTPAEFRASFPQFVSATLYPDSSVQFWLTLAGKLLRPERWQDVLPEGIGLFVAHNLALEGPAGAGSKTPGVGTGMVASKTVGKLSVSYDNSVGIDATAGHWNLTTFGMRFLTLMRMAGTGGIQLGAGGYGGLGPSLTFGYPPYGE